MHDPAQLAQGWVGRKVLVDQRLERAAAPGILVRISRARGIEPDGPSARLQARHRFRLDKTELCFRIDKPAHQPGGGRPVHAYGVAGSPEQRLSLPLLDDTLAI